MSLQEILNEMSASTCGSLNTVTSVLPCKCATRADAQRYGRASGSPGARDASDGASQFEHAPTLGLPDESDSLCTDDGGTGRAGGIMDIPMNRQQLAVLGCVLTLAALCG